MNNSLKHFLSVKDIDTLPSWVSEARELKADPWKFRDLGAQKTLCLLFFNNSLRTRLSTQKAANLLGMEVMVMNFGAEGWLLEYQDGTLMDSGKAEHIREAAQVVSQYADIIAIRAFAGLKDKALDLQDQVLNGFVAHATVPIVNMESAVAHPLQALADAITLDEYRKKPRPKVVLSWAPHPRALPHAVANSFIAMMQQQDADFVITHPEEYALNPEVVKGSKVIHSQEQALEGADFVYVKNWSSFQDYGKVVHQDPSWMMTLPKLGKAHFMHCLPVRRNVVVADQVMDSNQSLVIAQANNRTFSAMLVLKKILEAGRG